MVVALPRSSLLISASIPKTQPLLALNCPNRGLKLHSLRHTFGTYLIGMGYDITVVRDLLGHEDIKTTLIYAKADAARLRDAIRSFEKLDEDGYKMVTEGGMEMEEPLTKVDRSQVALSIEVTVPGTRNWNHSHTPIGNLS